MKILILTKIADAEAYKQKKCFYEDLVALRLDNNRYHILISRYIGHGGHLVSSKDFYEILDKAADNEKAYEIDKSLSSLKENVSQAPSATQTPLFQEKAKERPETECCCECGKEYPRSDLISYGHIFCVKCRGLDIRFNRQTQR